MTQSDSASMKKILPAFIICFLFGYLGIHRFYAGRTRSGIGMLVLSISIIGLLVTSVWSFVDLILLACGEFKDGSGLLLKDWT
jgi:TM2 domain-containing membrane protein YozV